MIDRGYVDGVTPEDAPLLFENARILDKSLRPPEPENPLEDPSHKPDTAARLEDPTSIPPAPPEALKESADGFSEREWQFARRCKRWRGSLSKTRNDGGCRPRQKRLAGKGEEEAAGPAQEEGRRACGDGR